MLFNPLMPYLHPRNSGLIAFKGGGGGDASGAAASGVATAVSTGSDAASDTGASSNVGETVTTSVTDNNQSLGGMFGGTDLNSNMDGFGGTGNTGTVATEDDIYGGPIVNPAYDPTLDLNGDGAITVAEQNGTASSGNTGSISSGNSGSPSGGGGGGAPAQQIITQQIDTSDLAKSAAMDTGFANVMRDTGNILADTGQIKTDVNQGFADVGGQLTGLGTQIGNNQTALTGQISDLSGNVTEGFANTSNALDTGFAGLNTNLNTQFDTQNQNITDMSANILGGQTNLQDYLEGMSGRADTYYGGLAEGQSNIMGEVGGLQSGLTDFRNTYDDNTTIANQTRNQLIDQVVGGFEGQEQAQAEYNSAAQKERADIAANIAQQASVAPNANASYAPALRDIAVGNAPTTTQQAAAQNEAASRINAVKNLIGTVGQNLSPELRQQYQVIATSFDDNGKLIPMSTDTQGNRTQRAMDNESNLLTTTINTANQVTDQRAVNVDRLLSYMDELGYTGGSNTSQLTGSGLMGQTINTFS